MGKKIKRPNFISTELRPNFLLPFIRDNKRPRVDSDLVTLDETVEFTRDDFDQAKKLFEKWDDERD